MDPKILDQARAPSPMVFPLYLNPAAVTFWFEATSNLDKDYKRAWSQALIKFRTLCYINRINPLRSADQSNNSAIQLLFWHQRQLLVQFLDLTKIMTGIPFTFPLVRKAWPTETGFRVEIKGQIKVTDPTWIKTLIRLRPARYRFGIQQHGKYWTSKINEGLTVFVYNDMIRNPNRWHIGYWVDSPLEPNLGDLPPTQFEWFVLTHLWEPVTKKLRAKKAGRIRYL